MKLAFKWKKILNLWMWKDGANLITMCYNHCKLLVSISHKEAYFSAHFTLVDVQATLNCPENHELSHYARFVFLIIMKEFSYKILRYFLSNIYRNFDISSGSLLITVILKARYTRKISWGYCMLFYVPQKVTEQRLHIFYDFLCTSNFRTFY